MLRARELVRKVRPATVPVAVEAYAREAGAVMKLDSSMPPDQPGWSFCHGDKHFICVNANDLPERQRFTICHELGHIVLGLPSQHEALPWWSYAKRPLSEIICDVFAAELLLPFDLFMPAAEKVSMRLAGIDGLASTFGASVTATGSRFADVASAPCTFILSEQGKVRYASRSKALREERAWIPLRVPLPEGSLSSKLRAGQVCREPEQVDADVWLSDWERGGVLLEEARHLARWDQTLTLLWFEDGEVPSAKRNRWSERDEDAKSRGGGEEDELLQELDGNLRWPGKRRRR